MFLLENQEYWKKEYLYYMKLFTNSISKPRIPHSLCQLFSKMYSSKFCDGIYLICIFCFIYLSIKDNTSILPKNVYSFLNFT